ncbi:hypothetical protein PSTG_14265 [Puccinia striiformis f. sp. tritici PST-78]|uniref:Nucleoside phosphorylase domain-containing protein n=1 Tax=Puccinia striiformis f. sp. tritici PST-78 TaxID=1165861 RepID=A0A0L0UZ51_9BASI|nr:hypothetical protein PSTG_14265 [Puccinia striiformis f. sp. tritici PST-78]
MKVPPSSGGSGAGSFDTGPHRASLTGPAPARRKQVRHILPAELDDAPQQHQVQPSGIQDDMKQTILDANFPFTEDRRTYHVALKHGEVANRVLTVGDHVRARRIAKFLDSTPKVFELTSQRGFTTFTGCYLGVPVSIVAIGMGYPMMDFFVREVRAVVTGDLIIVRLGSCGTLVPEIPVGRVVVCSRSLAIWTNYDYFQLSDQERDEFRGTPAGSPYLMSRPIGCDQILHDALTDNLERTVDKGLVSSDALHSSADTFYAGQGRLDSNFMDHNQALLENLSKLDPSPVTLEMETTHLFHLAAINQHKSGPTGESTEPDSFCQGKGQIRVAAAHITFAGRISGDFIEPEMVEKLEFQAGKGCLETLISQEIDQINIHPVENCVWASPSS